MRGIVLYEGPSELDGSPIVAIATGLAGSRNTKTGHMVQVYIMRSDIHPIDAVASGTDAAICGDCKLGPAALEGRACYVTLGHGPSSVFRGILSDAYTRGVDAGQTLEGRAVRVGAYGDPAAVPAAVWDAATARAATVTSYTHQWRKRPDLAAMCMASVDTEAERLEAKALGFRTFRVRAPGAAVLKGEGRCPASAEMGKATTCAACGLCDGRRSGKRGDISIEAHGGAGNARAFAKITA